MDGGNTKSYKLRRSGNSTISTIPLKIKELLNVEVGDEIEFIIVGKQVHLQKAKSVIDSYSDKAIQQAVNRHNSNSEE